TSLPVKVPIGKNCGFVQFVRKADAQRAIEKMQGFPIAGSRIRLSWGRSQYSRCAKSKRLRTLIGPCTTIRLTSFCTPICTKIQSIAIPYLRALGIGAYPAPSSMSQKLQDIPAVNHLKMYHPPSAGLFAEETLRAAHLASREDVVGGSRLGFNASGSIHDPSNDDGKHEGQFESFYRS
ncbi:hypothetical protein MPER_08607, partial [Moniliophthora perniciosa FA553]